MRKMIAAADRRKGKAPAESVQVAAAKPQEEEGAARSSPSMKPPPMSRRRSRPHRRTCGDRSPYFIQLGSFSDGENAARVRDQFASVWPVQFIELSGAAGPVYRVRLGPITNSDDAQTALIDAQTAGFGDAKLIRNEAVQASLN